jgi:hypothetical protein
VAPLELSLPISFHAVSALRKRLVDTLGVHLSASTLVARAIEAANEGLPRAHGVTPSADELFDEILGLPVQVKTVRGAFMPQIEGLVAAEAAMPEVSAREEVDVIDFLAGKKARKHVRKTRQEEMVEDVSMFRLVVPKEEERRAMIFLERVKALLEVEPGRLVL